MRHVICVLIILGFSSLSSLHAEQLTVGDFKKFCAPTNPSSDKSKSALDTVQQLRCWAYIDGVTDGLVIAATLGEKKLFCLPNEGLVLEGSLRMLKNFVEAKKLEDSMPMRGIVAAAFKLYFPCNE